MAASTYVWIWLPGAREPTLCGHLAWDGRAASFAYVRSYPSRPGAISIHPRWPLNSALGERYFPAEDDPLPGVIADVAPGRWGDYVLEKIHGRRLNAFEALLAGNQDRTGALEFGMQPDAPPEHQVSNVDLEELAEVVEQLDRGEPLDLKKRLLFRHGPSLGGRRPKATVQRDGRSWIAKFVSVQDRDQQQPRREAFGLALARAAGIAVPDFQIVEVLGKPVLLVERFDRGPAGERRHIVSARSLQNLSERQVLTDASYVQIATILRHVSDQAAAAEQWFDRMIFNIVLGNTDDHALNHLFGWDGRELSLMPAFDLEQQPDDGDYRTHEMIIGVEGKRATYENAVSMSVEFGLRPAWAHERIERITETCRLRSTELLHEMGLDADAAGLMRKGLLLGLNLGRSRTGLSG